MIGRDSRQNEFTLRIQPIETYTGAMRHVLPLLLIVALLICPHRCQGSFGAGCAVESATSTCACCKHRAANRGMVPPNKVTTPENRPAPLSHPDDCSCGSCLCHGAILEKSDLTLGPFSFVDFHFVPVGASLATVGNLKEWNDRPPVFGAPVGRCLRLAIHSLQI